MSLSCVPDSEGRKESAATYRTLRNPFASIAWRRLSSQRRPALTAGAGAVPVPAADVGDAQVMLAGALEPGDDVADVGLGPDVLADPAGRAPLQGVQLAGRVAPDRRLGDLPL